MENITRRDCIQIIGLFGAALAFSPAAIAKESDLEIIVKDLDNSYKIKDKEDYFEEAHSKYGNAVWNILSAYIESKSKVEKPEVKKILHYIDGNILKLRSPEDILKINLSLIKKKYFLLFPYDLTEVMPDDDLARRLHIGYLMEVHKVIGNAKYHISIKLPSGKILGAENIAFLTEPVIISDGFYGKAGAINMGKAIIEFDSRSSPSLANRKRMKLHEGIHTILDEIYGISEEIEPKRDIRIQLNGHTKIFTMNELEYNEALALTGDIIGDSGYSPSYLFRANMENYYKIQSYIVLSDIYTWANFTYGNGRMTDSNAKEIAKAIFIQLFSHINKFAKKDVIFNMLEPSQGH
jgi:hypothetical protein